MRRIHQLLILSLILVNLFGWISEVEVRFGVPQVVKYVLSVTILAIIIYYKVSNPSKPRPEGLFYPLIVLFVVWSLFLIVYALFKTDSLFYIQRILSQRFFFIPYLLPLLILYTRFDIKFFGHLFHYLSILIIPCLMIQVYTILITKSQINWGEQVGLITLFDIGSVLLLFTAHISQKKYLSYFIIVYFLLWFILWSFYGRRGMLIENVIMLAFFIVIRLRTSYFEFSDRIRIYFSLYFLILFLIMFGYLFTSTYAFERGFSGNAFEESRGLVFEAFFYDFDTTIDWIFGRGLDGRILRFTSSDQVFTAVENGFLTILLKGGLLYSVPFVVILLRASYLGFFKSRNDLAKALASLLIIHVIMMFYFNIPDFSTRYILVWISASACFNPEIRNYSDEEVKEAFNLYSKKKSLFFPRFV